jgi:hypothetical protein
MQQNEMETLLIDVDLRTRIMDTRLTAVEERLTAVDERVRNIDARTTRIEQILPTLATKADLAEGLQRVMTQSRTLYEDLKSSISLVAEHVAGIYARLDQDRGI